MPLLESPSDTFTVKSGEDDDSPVYIVRVPKLIDRSNYSRAVAASGARFPGNIEMMRELIAALGRMSENDGGWPHLEFMTGLCQGYSDDFRLWIDKKGSWADKRGEMPAMPEEVLTLWDNAAKADERFAGMVADRAVYTEKAAQEAARMFLVGIENIEYPYDRKRDGRPPDALLASIPLADLAAISDAVSERMTPSEARLKNSDWRAGGRPALESSPTTAMQPQTLQ